MNSTDLTDLPDDLFLSIVSYLEPRDCILGRRVSRAWNVAFTDSELCRRVLRQHYPRARELRISTESITSFRPHTLLVNNSRDSSWADILTIVASRYHFLQSGKPRCIEKLSLGKSFVVPEWSRVHPVAPWQRHLQFESKTAAFHYPDTLWTYADGLLIFPSSKLNDYVLYDLQRQTFARISFEPRGKIVRRLRLAGKTLVIEWCESESYHQLNENETVHRHFSTAYDIIFSSATRSWQTILRNEWKIHFLGMPLNSTDRFYSTHDDNHYAFYLWQPNRSAWGEDEPIETLAIWDISSPSAYQPSLDPAGEVKPLDLTGPRVIRRLSFSDLDFYNIRQRSCPSFRNLLLDENHVYFVEEDHRWAVGQQAGDNLPRIHKVKTTGIPFMNGPARVDECGADGDVSMSFCERESDFRPAWMAPCWRHEEFPYLTITEALDEEAGVRFCARHCFMLETLSINIKPSVRMTTPGYQVLLQDDLWKDLLGTNRYKIAGDERWLIGENEDSEIVILHFNLGVINEKVIS